MDKNVSLKGSETDMRICQVVFDGFTDIDVFLAWDLLNRVGHPGWNVRLLGTHDQHTSAPSCGRLSGSCR